VRTSIAFVITALVIAGSGARPFAQCDGCLRARYWLAQQAGAPTKFPEMTCPSGAGASCSEAVRRLQQRLDVGVAFSGGGTRAASAALGQLRGLEHNGWLDRIRYVSAISGGAWAAVPFTFSDLPLSELLGTVEPALTLDPARVRATPNGKMGEAIARSALTAGAIREAGAITLTLREDPVTPGALGRWTEMLLGKLRPDYRRLNRTYANLIGETFLDPVVRRNSKTAGMPFAWDDQTLSEMTNANRGRLEPAVLAQTNRPFLVTGGTVISARPDYDHPVLMPIEYTPLYVGVRESVGGHLGGTYVWPWAYDAERWSNPVPDSPDGGMVSVTLSPNRRFSLADIVASSGAAPEYFLVSGLSVPAPYRSMVDVGAGFFPAFRHPSIQGGEAFVTRELPHADGGAGDNLGIMPLLARGVRNALVFVNTSTPDPSANNDIYSLFFSSSSWSISGNKGDNVIFDGAKYQRLLDDFREAADQGEPLVSCHDDYRILDNRHYGITSYGPMSVCFFYNARVKAWELDVVKATGSLLRRHPEKPTEDNRNHFPWFRTFGTNLPHFIQLKTWQVNLLSHLTAWTVTRASVVDKVRSAMPLLPCPAGTSCAGPGPRN
jgi:hypothetical protein